MADVQEGRDASGRSRLNFLADDVLLRICRFLPVKALLGTGAACVELQHRTSESLELWQELCRFLLGEASVLLHAGCWAASAKDAHSAPFYRRLFRAAWACESFCYDHGLRRALLDSAQGGRQPGGSSGREAVEDLLALSGHTSEAIGPLVLQVGGAQNDMSQGTPLHVTVFNLAEKRVFRPTLAGSSCRPEHRIRHATCAVRAPFLPEGPYQEAVLVLGGYGAPGAGFDTGRPRANVRNLLLLQIMAEDGSEICWHEAAAAGTAPEHIYHHACASFARGTRVCVFGGDIPSEDSEFARIEDRARSPFVYVLDMAAQLWQVVNTSGSAPSWRSLHAAVAHTSFLDGREYLVTFGGATDHCEPLTSANPAVMTGYELDLQSFVWRQGSSDGFMPAPRLRFGVARWGRHLVVHGGHELRGDDGDSAHVARLNLTTLRWASMDFANSPTRLPVMAFETGAPQAGIVVGGVNQTRLGPRMLVRLNLFRLRDPSATHAVDCDAEQDGEPEEEEDPDPDDDAGMQWVRIQMRRSDGSLRVLEMPMVIMAAMRQQAGSDEALVEMLRAHVARQDAAGDADDS